MPLTLARDMARRPSSSRAASSDAPLPARAGLFARVRAVLIGGAMSFLGALTLIALFSYNPFDPSLNAATGQNVSNLAGPSGAIAADLLLQTMGWAGACLALMVLGWGLILTLQGPIRRPLPVVLFRIVCGAFALCGFAAAVSALPVPLSWPFASGLGGLLGDSLLSGVSGLAVQAEIAGANAIAAVLGLLAAILGTFFCFGLNTHDLAAASAAAVRVWETVRGWARRLMDELPASWRSADDRPLEISGEARAENAPAILRGGRAPAAGMATPRRAGQPDARTAPDVKIAPKGKPKPSDREAREAQAALPFNSGSDFEMPRLDLLAKATPRKDEVDADGLRQNAELLAAVLGDFGVKGEIVEVRPGPVVTLYELEPAPGVKTSRVINLADDIARSMAAVACRVAVVPGRNAIGIELPNTSRETVFLRTLLSSSGFEKNRAELPLALGETIGGEPFTADLSRMPHLLIAGTTGSGKSVGINAMILSLLYRLPPEECRMIMIDPKMLELSVYDGIPHLLSPVVTDPKKAVAALKWTVREMESRYLRMSKVGVRNMAGFNEKAAEAREAGEMLSRTVQTGFDRESGEPVYETETIEPDHMPYIVVVIDEMADLMMVAGKEIEGAVQRLAQMARAAGIHVIMATQRPSVDVITGTIKANFPTRISYQVTSKIDSRTILGEQGAEQLLGQGDLLLMAGGGRIRRLHGPFVSDREVEEVASFLKKQRAPEYLDAVTEDIDEEGGIPGLDGGEGGSGDDLFDQAVAVVARDRKASTSYIQRRLQIGYNRAASLIERMEDEGMIGPSDHSGKREIYLPERERV